MDWARTQLLFDEEQSRQERASTLAQLEQDQRILLLQRDIQRLRGEVGESSPRRDSRIQFKDLENAVPEFSGDDNYSVRKWIDDFEEVVDVYDVDARFRYLAARKLLKGTARIFMQKNSFADWPALRAALIQRYDRQLTGMEVRTQLARRTKKSDETYQRYVCCMEEIARQSERVSEAEIVEAIIYGLRDHSGRAAILNTARTVEELCRLLIRYERRIQHANRANNTAAVAARGNSAASTSDRKSKTRTRPVVSTVPNSVIFPPSARNQSALLDPVSRVGRRIILTRIVRRRRRLHWSSIQPACRV